MQPVRYNNTALGTALLAAAMSVHSAIAEPLLQTGQRKSKLLSVCPYVLGIGSTSGTEFCERLAFYGIAINLPIYLTQVMKLSVADASVHTSLFTGTCYVTPLLGAWLADGYWGRYKTIVVFSSVYCAVCFCAFTSLKGKQAMQGMALLAAIALVPGLGPHHGASVQPEHFIFLYTALYIVALGTGGIKANVNTFGADQFDETDPEEILEKQAFFNWFYFSINFGGIIAMTVIVWIQSWSWGLGYAIPALAMALAIVIFLAGLPMYSMKQPAGSPIATATILSWHALKELLGSYFTNAPRAAAIGEPGAVDEAGSGARQDCLDRAGEKYGYTRGDVASVRLMLRLLPVFGLMMSYFTVYSHMASVFVLQGQHMDRYISIGGRGFLIPAASMPLFDTGSILLLIPLYNNGLKPLLKHMNCDLSTLARIGWGCAMAAVAMLVAGMMERWRMQCLEEGHKLTVLAQITQYALVGTSEVFAAVGQIEFFYDQAPASMRSLAAALGLLSVAGGGYISAAFLSLVSSTTSWLNNINDPHTSHLDDYLFLLSLFMLINTLLFVWVSYRYK